MFPLPGSAIGMLAPGRLDEALFWQGGRLDDGKVSQVKPPNGQKPNRFSPRNRFCRHTTNVVWRHADSLLNYIHPSPARRRAVMKFVQIWEGNQFFVVPGAEDTRDDS